MIEKERIEEVKRSVDLVALIESKGISLKKNGKSYKGLCPFHEDTNPSLSINPNTNLWQCFGCSKGGDAIRFIELYENIGFKEAVTLLAGIAQKGPGIGGQGPANKRTKVRAGSGESGRRISPSSVTVNPQVGYKMESDILPWFLTLFGINRGSWEFFRIIAA